MFRFCLNNYICTESRCNSWVHWLSTNHISIFMITSKKHIHFIPWFLYVICFPAVKTSNYFQGLMRALPHFLVSMFVCGFFLSHSSPLLDNVSKFFTDTRHSWPMSSEDSLACHTYCDTEHPFTFIMAGYIWSSSKILDTRLLPSV